MPIVRERNLLSKNILFCRMVSAAAAVTKMKMRDGMRSRTKEKNPPRFTPTPRTPARHASPDLLSDTLHAMSQRSARLN